MPVRPKGRRRKPPVSKADNSALKIRVLGKDNVPLTMAELREGPLEAARQLLQYEPGYRVKSAAIYLPMIARTAASFVSMKPMSL
ncbi:hypothetical protein [Nitrobacter vulgaris]|uniref:hypothetical protein n=1 Tax=Nitrobacter vulgaris TaxID=29421 RepID=UPI001FCD38FF|nr:hypothetical protein [Nitrobacter vulgaris]